MTYSNIYQKRDAIAKFAKWNMYKLKAKNPATNPVWTLEGQLISREPDLNKLVKRTVKEVKIWTDIDIEVVTAFKIESDDGFSVNISFKILAEPHCSCGSTVGLTEVGVRPGHPYYLCPRCFAEESLR